MSYFQTDDIPTSIVGKVKPNLKLVNPTGKVLFNNVKSHTIRYYYKNEYVKDGGNGKRVWREELTKLGYKIENVTT